MENTLELKEVKPKKEKRKKENYAKWGYIFIIPFFVAYLTLTLYPQIKTIYYSFFEYRLKISTMEMIGPKFVGFENYIEIFQKAPNGRIMILEDLGNTMCMWIIGMVFQLAVALILALFFTSTRLNIKCAGFFKSVFYMPNLIMASAVAYLFYQIFNPVGPFNQIALALGWIDKAKDFTQASALGTRCLVAFMNFLLWFGNTTILLMAGIMGIDESLFESARIDGASSGRVFRDITLPLLKPILIYVIITSMIGGLQMFDVPEMLTKGQGFPDYSTQTIIMMLNSYLKSENYGMAGTVAVLLFLVTGALSFAVFKAIDKKD